MKFIISLRDGIETMIQQKNGYVIGEDIQEPYGGAFKVTKGLSEKYPDNIIGTPMCEQGFTGLGIGMSLYGCYVTVEIMFGDFITLIADQMINHASKFHDMYSEEMHLVVRCPSGGYRGYGATHSQSLEKLFMGIPGMQVIAPSIAFNPGALFNKAIDSGIPTLFVENKLDYPRELLEDSGDYWIKRTTSEEYPMAMFLPLGDEPDITIITYGGLVSMAMEVMKYYLYEEEINIAIMVPSELSNTSSIINHIETNKAVIIEEGVSDFGWGAEVCYHLSRQGIRCRKIGALLRTISASKTSEELILPSKNTIVNAIREELT